MVSSNGPPLQEAPLMMIHVKTLPWIQVAMSLPQDHLTERQISILIQ